MTDDVLIVTKFSDVQAIFVAAAIHEKGASARLWYTSDYPMRQTQSLRMRDSQTVLSICPDRESAILQSAYASIWYRRPHAPAAEFSRIDRRDREFVARNGRRYFLGLEGLFSNPELSPVRGMFANTPMNAMRAETKPFQLAIAADLGWNVPDTLISNNLQAICSFIGEQGGSVIHKSLTFYGWREGEVHFPTRASAVAVGDLPSQNVLRHSPEVFQAKIDKDYEVRVLFFGSTYIATMIKPMSGDCDIVDWRDNKDGEGWCLKRVSLPSLIEKLCRATLADMGLVTASFDLAIDRDGAWYFLELNQAGQFVWQEPFCTLSIHAFSEFLISGDPEFCWREPEGLTTTAELRASEPLQQLLAEESFSFRPPGLNGRVNRGAMASKSGGLHE